MTANDRISAPKDGGLDYSRILSGKIQDIKPSGIRKFFDLLNGMSDVVALTVGEPDFVTPWHIRSAGIESLEKGKTYYTSNAGLVSLREEIASYLNRRFGLTYDPVTEVVVTVGGSEAIDLTMRALIEPGDEVIVPQPSFVCYGPICEMAHGVPVYIPTKEENHFKLTADELRAAITPKTKLVILPFPSNPTGAIMTREDLEAIAEVLRGTDIMVLSDEIYSELTYGRTHVSPAAIDGMWERTILASGFSKTYAMTGWRIGYGIMHKDLAKQMDLLMVNSNSCTASFTQMAAKAALEGPQTAVDEMREAFRERRDWVVNALNDIPGITCRMPRGAFYAFPDISSFGLDSQTFCFRLLEEGGVAAGWGSSFGKYGEATSASPAPILWKI